MSEQVPQAEKVMFGDKERSVAVLRRYADGVLREVERIRIAFEATHTDLYQDNETYNTFYKKLNSLRNRIRRLESGEAIDADNFQALKSTFDEALADLRSVVPENTSPHESESPPSDSSADAEASPQEEQTPEVTKAYQERLELRNEWKAARAEHVAKLREALEDPDNTEKQSAAQAAEQAFRQARQAYVDRLHTAVSERGGVEKWQATFSDRFVIAAVQEETAVRQDTLPEAQSALLEKTQDVLHKYRKQIKGIGWSVAAGAMVVGGVTQLASYLLGKKVNALAVGTGAAAGAGAAEEIYQYIERRKSRKVDESEAAAREQFSPAALQKLEASLQAAADEVLAHQKRHKQYVGAGTAAGAVAGLGVGMALNGQFDAEETIDTLQQSDTTNLGVESDEIVSNGPAVKDDVSPLSEPTPASTEPSLPQPESEPPVRSDTPEQPPMPDADMAPEHATEAVSAPASAASPAATETAPSVEWSTSSVAHSVEGLEALPEDTIITLPEDGRYSLWNLAEGDVSEEQPAAFAAAAEKGQLQQLIHHVVSELEDNPAARAAVGVQGDNPNLWLYAGDTFNLDAYNRLAEAVGVEKGIFDAEAVAAVPQPESLASTVEDLPTAEAVPQTAAPTVTPAEETTSMTTEAGPSPREVDAAPAAEPVSEESSLSAEAQASDTTDTENKVNESAADAISYAAETGSDAQFTVPEQEPATFTTETTSPETAPGLEPVSWEGIDRTNLLSTEQLASLEAELHARVAAEGTLASEPALKQMLVDRSVVAERLATIPVFGEKMPVADFLAAEGVWSQTDYVNATPDSFADAYQEYHGFMKVLQQQGLFDGMDGRSIQEVVEQGLVNGRIEVTDDEVLVSKPTMFGGDKVVSIPALKTQ